MKKRVRQAAIKLMLLQEEFTKSELDEAASFLSVGKTSDLIDYLRETKPTGCTTSARSSAEDTDRLSKVVQALEASDPERHSILAEFETMVREGAVVPTLGEIKKLGSAVSKQFEPGKSRKDSIPRLMAVLAPMPLDEMKEAIRKVTEQSKLSEGSSSSYARLAQHLIGSAQGGQ